MNAPSPRARFPFVTVTLIAASVAVTLLSNFGESSFVLPFLISSGGTGFSDIASGEVWRLVTPMFVHFKWVHLLFNMLWLLDLGRIVELVRGPAFLGVFVLATSALSNVAQYAIKGNPGFGGMSGVVYALLGYVWMQGHFNPRFGFELHKVTVILLLAWFVLCWIEVLPVGIANWAHTVGLLAGVAWGFLDARRGRAR